jgi:DNA topoisomerase-1
MNLVIVESPAKATTINKYLGRDFKVLASYGHVRDLPSKAGSVDPNKDFSLTYKVDKSSEKQLKAIIDSVKTSKKIILATDPDREGESISWHIIEALKEKKKLPQNIEIERVAFNEITKSAIIKAINNPRKIDIDLVNAQQARRVLDYLVGFTLSPILWRKLPGSRSAGRVQSVALRLICEREQEIEKFKPIEYWSIKGDFTADHKDKFEAKLFEIKGEKLTKFAIENEEQAKLLESEISSKKYNITDIKAKNIKRNPYAPFTTSTLQQDASIKLGFTTKRTMQIAQKLYEGININGETKGLITYMRTDGVSIAKAAIDKIRDYVTNKYGRKYITDSARIYKNKVKNAQEAHEAIRPTDIALDPDNIKEFLSVEQLKLYQLIWSRALASQMSAQESLQTSVEIKSEDQDFCFRATGNIITFKGFTIIYGKSENDKNLLPELSIKSKLELDKITTKQHFTEPPPRYNEASLVKTMEELAIGRPSTYASIISILVDRNYAKIEQKRFYPEERGMLVTAFLVEFFEKYFEYDFTAKLEDGLDDISNGKINWKEFLHNFWLGFEKICSKTGDKEPLEIAQKITDSLSHHYFGESEEARKCPTCNDGELSLRMGKFGAFIACSNYPDCKFTRKIGDDSDSEENSNQILGQLEDGQDLELKKGPYGYYLEYQLAGKAKRVAIPKHINIDDLDIILAKKIVSLPRNIGVNPDNNQDILVNNGKFGPYLLCNKTFYSIANEDLFSIDLAAAMELIRNAKKPNNELKILGEYPDTKEDIKLQKGRYGPYLKLGKKNIAIPKNIDALTITLEEAIKLIKTKKK